MILTKLMIMSLRGYQKETVMQSLLIRIKIIMLLIKIQQINKVKFPKFKILTKIAYIKLINLTETNNCKLIEVNNKTIHLWLME